MEHQFKEGDVVFSKTYQCDVTIEKINPPTFEVVWFDKEGHLHRDVRSLPDLC